MNSGKIFVCGIGSRSPSRAQETASDLHRGGCEAIVSY